jgi:type VI secretion system protein ImpM
VTSFAPPQLQPRAPELSGLIALPEGAVLARDIGGQVTLAFRAARRFGHRSAFAAQSFWWTIGGEGFPAMTLSVVGLPLATRFADFLTGAFDTGAEAEHGG